MDARAIDPRMQRGIALAKTKGETIKAIIGAKYLVPSQTHSGGYVVDTDDGSCTCPDFLECGGHGRVHRCKHLWATLIVRHEVELPDGNTLVTEEKIRFQYDRNWPAINAALVDLHRIGPAILADLVRFRVPSNDGQPRKRGEQPVPMRDLIYAALIRTFENKTARSTMASVERFQAVGLCENVPHYNTLLRNIAKPEVMPILHGLLGACAAPLAVIESGKLAQYAIDSTGFSTSIYASWREKKHGKPNTHTVKARYVKAHAFVGTTTKAIVAIQPTEPDVGDAPMLAPLLTRAIENGHHPREVTADAAYLSSEVVAAIEAVNAQPFIAFREGVTGVSRPIIAKLYHRFMADQEEYMRKYHRRSNVETVMHMCKERFGGRLRSRRPSAQYAEIMLKAICHDVACLVTAIHELEIDPKFWTPASNVVPLFGTNEGVTL